jgi:maleamate amidohydrolase
MTSSLDKNYSKAYGHSLTPGARPALILVDLVQAYFDPDCELFADVDDALQSALRILNLARDRGLFVIYTNVVYQGDGLDGGRFYEKALPLKHFRKGSPMGDFTAGIHPLENELVVSKQYPSAFFGTSLASTLTAKGIDTLIITGVTTSGCIRASCVDALSNGFIPIVVSDACGDRHEAPHEANLFDMQAKYAEVWSEAEVCDYLHNISIAETG